MSLDVDSLVETVEHQKHGPDSFDHSISDTLRGIWQHTQNKRTYTLGGIIELGAQILDHLNVNVLVASQGVGIIKPWCVN